MPRRAAAALALVKRAVNALGLLAAIGAQATFARPPDACPFAAYWCDSRRGWHFYEQPTPAPRKQTDVAAPLRASPLPTPAPVVSSPPPSELAVFKRLQESLEDARKIAIVSPSEANVTRYLELEHLVVSKSSLFADVAQRVAWSRPDLDNTLQGRPVNATALEVFEKSRLDTRSRDIAALARDHVLFFFFRSDCPYCHAYAPILRHYSERYGLTVVPVSVDGPGLPEFPVPRRDNGIARTLGVMQVPATFLAQPNTGTILSIGFGVLSESELTERITTLTAPNGPALAPGAVHHVQIP